MGFPDRLGQATAARQRQLRRHEDAQYPAFGVRECPCAHGRLRGNRSIRASAGEPRRLAPNRAHFRRTARLTGERFGARPEAACSSDRTGTSEISSRRPRTEREIRRRPGAAQWITGHRTTGGAASMRMITRRMTRMPPRTGRGDAREVDRQRSSARSDPPTALQNRLRRSWSVSAKPMMLAWRPEGGAFSSRSASCPARPCRPQQKPTPLRRGPSLPHPRSPRSSWRAGQPIS